MNREKIVLPMRTVSLEPVQIDKSEYDVAVIASLFRESKDDLLWYASYLVRELSGLHSQVVFVDNTRGVFLPILPELQSIFKNSSIEFSLLGQPKRGKVNGLNTSLQTVRSEIVLPVDPNKKPHKGTLSGLVARVNSQKMDLVSARIFGPEHLYLAKQTHNAGAGYALRTRYLTYFPPVINEDAFVRRMVAAREGSFQVASDLMIDDYPNSGGLVTAAKRTARHRAGAAQLNAMRVYSVDEPNKVYELKKYAISSENKSALLRVFTSRLQKLVTQKQYSEARKMVQRLLHKKTVDILSKPYYKEYLEKLLQNPDLCYWDV